MTRAELLQQHVEAVEGHPVVWGESDCTTWPAAWIERATGRKVPMLGAYSTLDDAHRLIDEAGGLDVLWTRALAQVEIFSAPIYDAALGDVGIMRTSTGNVGVIFAADGTALWRAESGTAVIRPRAKNIVKVWALPEE